jgi:hypothetical protein
MTDDEWAILRPMVDKCKKSAAMLQAADQLPVPQDEKRSLEHWLSIRKLQKAHDKDVADMEKALERLGLI